MVSPVPRLRLVVDNGRMVRNGEDREEAWLTDAQAEDQLAATLSELCGRLDPASSLLVELRAALARLEHRRARRGR